MIEQGLLQVLEKIYRERGLDFRQYKESSLRRRIERRFKATRVDFYQQYIELLDSDPSEYKKLIDSLTIKVTEFFRDPEAWQSFFQKVLPEIVKDKIENTCLPKRSGGQGKENESPTMGLHPWYPVDSLRKQEGAFLHGLTPVVSCMVGDEGAKPLLLMGAENSLYRTPSPALRSSSPSSPPQRDPATMKDKEAGRGEEKGEGEPKADRSNNFMLPVIRIWSAGCATGEEAYSMAILLNELLENKVDNFEFSVYGTNIDKDSLEKAKEAAYRIETVNGKITDEILDKYFIKNGCLRVKDSVKRNCFFLFHDLVLDEPLTEMDLILCRNVAIYFERPLQEKIYMDFYNALNEKGYLFLGKAETLIGPAQGKFRTIDKRWKIYQKG